MALKKVDPISKNVEELATFMKVLKHPLKKEMEELRSFIKSIDSEISERFKWKAPSYHVKEQDFLTFNPRDGKRIHLVWHHPKIEDIQSALLEGEYEGRRMTYFESAADIKSKQAEFKKVLKKLLQLMRS
jgi:uncharacterized protein YdhG (YjbR/CyaY superfamily)